MKPRRVAAGHGWTSKCPTGRGQEVVILIIDDFGAREVYRQTVAGGTTLHEFVEGRGDQARLQVYVGGVMYMDQPFPD